MNLVVHGLAIIERPFGPAGAAITGPRPDSLRPVGCAAPKRSLTRPIALRKSSPVKRFGAVSAPHVQLTMTVRIGLAAGKPMLATHE
jgi:hypothetical protein